MKSEVFFEGEREREIVKKNSSYNVPKKVWKFHINE